MAAKSADRPAVARRPLSRRSPRSAREWVVRGGLAAVAIALGYISTTHTLAFALADNDPARGYALNRGDGRIAARLAERQMATEGNDAQRPAAEQLARRALIAEPLATEALTALGLARQFRGDTPGAASIFAAADRQSRREFGTRLWLIEDAVRRDDVPGALRHYDIALRTSKNAPELLFPVLGSAIGDPAIAASMVRLLASRPAWGDAFIGYLGTEPPDPDAAAALFVRLARRGVAVPQGAKAGLIDQLVVRVAFGPAWALYRATHKGVDVRHSRDPDFGRANDRPTVFDWVPVTSDQGLSGSIQQEGDRGLFEYAAPATVGGVVLQQLQLLPSGRYRLSGRVEGIEPRDGPRPYWLLACLDGRELGRVELGSAAGDAFDGPLTVPAGCAAQHLRLVIRPSNAITGAAGRVLRAEIRPS